MAAIGIDLGTSNSCVAVVHNGKVEVIPNELKERTTPSIIGYWPDKLVYGKEAKHKMNQYPENIIHGVKYLMGRKYNDESLAQFIHNCNYSIISNNNEIQIAVDSKEVTPQEISAYILKQLKSNAEQFLKREVETAVITVPTYFDDSSRQATIDAGKIAGFKNVSLLNEPTAAALAYGVDNSDGEKNILVFDFGGGTFDISVLRLENGEYTVLGIDGDLFLGGDDVDRNIMDYILEVLHEEHEIQKDRRFMNRLKHKAESAKIALSSESETEISIISANPEFEMEIQLSRSKFNELNDELFSKCIDVMQGCLDKIQMRKEDVDVVLLVGGSTRIFNIRERLENYIGKIKQNVNPDEAVAIGAAIKASKLAGDDAYKYIIINQICAHSLGVETSPFGEFSCLVPKFSPIPKTVSKKYQTHPDGNPETNIKIYVGESNVAVENKFLGKFHVEGIYKGLDGLCRVTITFDIDSDGILKVTADDQRGTSANLTIELEKGDLSETEIVALTEKVETKYIAYKNRK